MIQEADVNFLSSVSRETMSSLEFLVAEVHKWNPKINLVSKRSLDHMMERHIVDSLQLYKLAPDSVNHWVDLGSGGGFPGLVIAIVARDRGFPSSLSLVESDKRKAVFLSEVVRQLGLNASVVNSRIEALDSMHADALSARALAPLTQLCEYAYKHMSPDGLAIFSKGQSYPDEIAEARKSWKFDVSVTPSLTSPAAAILTVSDIKHA